MGLSNITFGSVMLIPPCGRSIPAFFPHSLNLQMRGFFVRRGGLRMTGRGVFLYE
jgi:hypothetical protein